jgi:hypothetical protein
MMGIARRVDDVVRVRVWCGRKPGQEREERAERDARLASAQHSVIVGGPSGHVKRAPARSI